MAASDICEIIYAGSDVLRRYQEHAVMDSSAIAVAYRFESYSAFSFDECLADCRAAAASLRGRPNRGDHEHVPSHHGWSTFRPTPGSGWHHRRIDALRRVRRDRR